MPGVFSGAPKQMGRPVVGLLRRVARRLRTGARLAAALMPIVAVGGCAGLAPGGEGSVLEDHGVKMAQAMRMAEAVRAGGDMMAAAVFYRRAHSLAPDRPEPLIGLAQAAAAAGSNAEAAQVYRKALALAPQNAAARLGFGRVLLSLDRPDLAADELRAAIEGGSTDYRAYLALGVALDLSGDQPQAQRAYRDGLQRNPENLSLHNNLALSLALGGDHDEAISMLRNLARDLDSGPRVRQNLALVYALAGRMDEAVATARYDLRGVQLDDALAFYESLGTLTGERLAAAVVCGCNPTVPAGASSRASPAVSPAVSIQSSPRPGTATSTAPLPPIGRDFLPVKQLASLRPPRVAVVNTASKTVVVMDPPGSAAPTTAIATRKPRNSVIQQH
jgi:Flp pilus assembly protein TadD